MNDEKKKFGVKICRERKCPDLKVRDPEYPQSGEQCEVTGCMPGAMGCCPKEMADDQFIHRANLNYGPYTARPGPKNCPKECPYKIIIDGEKMVWEKGGIKGHNVPAKIPTCALTGWALKDSNLCPCNVLGNPRQEDQINRLKALVKMRLEYCEEDNPIIGMCAMGICPDGKDRERWGDDGNTSFCPVIRLPTSALIAGRGCPLWRIPAKLLSVESRIPSQPQTSTKKTDVKIMEQNNEKQQFQNKPPSGIKKEQQKPTGRKCTLEEMEAARKQVLNEMIAEDTVKENPVIITTHRDENGNECGGCLMPIWRRDRWLYICEECGYQEVPTTAQTHMIKEMIADGMLTAPPADKSRQGTLFEFREDARSSTPKCTEVKTAPCTSKNLTFCVTCGKGTACDHYEKPSTACSCVDWVKEVYVQHCCGTCGHHKGRKTFHESCPRLGELLFKGGEKSAKILMEETASTIPCRHWLDKKDRCPELSDDTPSGCLIGGSCTQKTEKARRALGCMLPVKPEKPAKKKERETS